MKGTFYAQELQKIVKTDKDLQRIDHIIGRQRKGVQLEYLVKWHGYSEQYSKCHFLVILKKWLNYLTAPEAA